MSIDASGNEADASGNDVVSPFDILSFWTGKKMAPVHFWIGNAVAVLVALVLNYQYAFSPRTFGTFQSFWNMSIFIPVVLFLLGVVVAMVVAMVAIIASSESASNESTNLDPSKPPVINPTVFRYVLTYISTTVVYFSLWSFLIVLNKIWDILGDRRRFLSRTMEIKLRENNRSGKGTRYTEEFRKRLLLTKTEKRKTDRNMT